MSNEVETYFRLLGEGTQKNGPVRGDAIDVVQHVDSAVGIVVLLRALQQGTEKGIEANQANE